MTVTGMNLSKPGVNILGQSSSFSSTSGHTPALDFAALISLISSGQGHEIVKADGVETSFEGEKPISTEELLKIMLSSATVSEESIPELSETDLTKLSENKSFADLAKSFLGLLSERSDIENFNLIPKNNFHLVTDNKTSNSSESNHNFPIIEDPSLISSGSNFLLHLLINDLKVVNESDPVDGISDSAPRVVDKIVNTSILDDKNTKILSINYENVIKELHDYSARTAHFIKLYAKPSKLLEESSSGPNILQLQVNAKVSNFDKGSEIKIHIVNQRDTLSQLDNLVRLIERPKEDEIFADLNIKDIDAVVAQFRIELDKDFVAESEAEPVKQIVIALQHEMPSDNEVKEPSSPIARDRTKPHQVQSFVDSNHAVLFDRVSSPKEISATVPERYVTLKFIENELNFGENGAENVNFNQPDKLDFTFNEDFLKTLSDIQSGKLSIKFMKDSLSSELTENNPSTLTLDQFRTPFANFLSLLTKKPSVTLKLSTADVLSYRNLITKDSRIKLNPTDAIEKILLPDNGGRLFESVDFPKAHNSRFGFERRDTSPEAVIGNNKSFNLNSGEVPINRPILTQGATASITNSLSLYDAQYSSRLGMLLTENIIKGQENFEIQLEPETFGKVRVSVAMENANLEVKILAENSAAMMALRSSETILQGITEQNGLKLSEYSVDMQNNNSNGENQGKNPKNNNIPNNSLYSDKEVGSDDILTNSETSHSLNLLA